MASTSIWIFGYGSLIWRPNFEYSRSVQGYVKGWKRVFWQGSTDHRGTPERPGRTATLCEDTASYTGVTVSEIGWDHGTPWQYLEWREKQYDIRHYADIYAHGEVPADPLDGLVVTAAEFCVTQADAEVPLRAAANGNATGVEKAPLGPSKVLVSGCLVYIAGPDKHRNANYLGPASLQDIAHQIATSSGPSGPNSEYLFGLADALRKAGIVDVDVFHLEQLVIEIMASKAAPHEAV